MSSHLSIAGFISFTPWILDKRSLPVPKYWSVLHTFSSTSLRWSGLCWGTYPAGVEFYAARHNFHSLFCTLWNTDFQAPFVEDAIISPLYIFGLFVKYEVAVTMWSCIRFPILFHRSVWSFCVITMPFLLLWRYSIIWSNMVIPLVSLLLFRSTVDFLSVLCLHMKFWICILCLWRVVLEFWLKMHLCFKMTMFVKLILLTHKYGKFLICQFLPQFISSMTFLKFLTSRLLSWRSLL